MNGLKLANVEVDRKILAELAVNHNDNFTSFINLAKDGIQNKVKTVAKKTASKKVKSDSVAE